ncbi:putative rhamnogalacturonase A [Mycena metata]|uniref:galacturonan 1,4-alpha-galacturonidase n=1 Tax=Mycena metata TaxID=1033252 RepID=A0AAD7K6Y8_9AGAR|nr:putative rhamnogalacturonase A [Mycena metata]
MQLLSVILLAALSATAQNPPHKNTCTVHAAGNGTDDAPAILAAFAKCGKGGNIVLPSANYTISQPMTTHLEGGQFDLHGYLSFTPDIDYWIANSYRFPFQNQSIAWHITGRDFVVDGHGTGGVFGNGQVWYSWARGAGNLYGRPMSVSITNATRAVVKNFRIIQPQFWSSLVWNSTDILLTDFYVNATNLDPAANGGNWVQNTDGSDTYESARITYRNWVYQGGDDCIAFKPNSTQITVRNVSCTAVNGMTFGSIGQYPSSFDILQDIHIEDVVVKNHPTAQLDGGAYFKSWIGVNVGIPPNGGGGGSGYCKNVTIKNLHVINATVPLLLTSELTYSQLNATYANTSTFVWDSVHFYNVTGTSTTGQVIDFECSTAAPCEGWTFSDINLTPAGGVKKTGDTVCHNFFDYEGLPECTA